MTALERLQALHTAATGPYRAGVLFGLVSLARRSPELADQALAEAEAFAAAVAPEQYIRGHWSLGQKEEAGWRHRS